MMLWTVMAWAKPFAFPTSESDYSKFYPTAYYDHDGSSGLEDWACGNTTYNGHSGNDFGVGSWSGMDDGRDITAAAPGVVVSTHDGEYDRCSTGDCGTSNSVYIEHSDGTESYYLHMRTWTVQVTVGETVLCGQKIGEVGSSGNSTGPHVHFGVLTSSGSVTDAFSGNCSSSSGYWVSQGSYEALPSRSCDPSAPKYISDAVMAALVTDQRNSTDINGDGLADFCGRANSGMMCGLGASTGFGERITTTLGAGDGVFETSPAYYSTFRWGDINGDRLDDLCLRNTESYNCYLSTGIGFSETPVAGAPDWSDARGFDDPDQYSTLRMLDINGDGRMDLCARSADGLECTLSTPTGFAPLFEAIDLSDARGWGDLSNAPTIRAGDINGDGRDDLCARADAKVICYFSTGTGFEETYIDGPAWSDSADWNMATHYNTFQVADINGDGLADLFGRSVSGVVFALSNGTGFEAEKAGPTWKDSSGWSDQDNSYTLRLGDIDGDGDLDLCGRANAAIYCAFWEGEGFSSGAATTVTWDDSHGWDDIDNYASIQLADQNGDGRADICGRGSDGISCALSEGTTFGATFVGDWGADASGWNQNDNWLPVMIAGPRSRGCLDGDGDQACDDVDGCPEDPNKIAPESCGCGAAEDCNDPQADDSGQSVSVLPGAVVPMDGIGCQTVPHMGGVFLGILALARRRSTR